MFKKWPYNFTIKVKNSPGAQQIVPWGLSNSKKRKELVAIFFSWESLPFFQKFVFSATYLVLPKRSYNLHKDCQSAFLIPIENFVRLLTFDKTRKIGYLLFLLERLPFFENFSFQQPLRCYGNELVTSQKKTKHLMKPNKLSPELCHTQ